MAAATSPLPHPSRPSVPPPRAAGPTTATASTSATASTAVKAASEMNRVRIVHVANRLARHFHSGFRSDPYELFHLCFALARGIDYAVSHDDVAPNAHDLPTLIKKVYQRKDDGLLRAALLVLLVSAKNACGKKWFRTADSTELVTMANEMSSSFCIGDNITSESSNALQVMLKVMPRYFPELKLSRLIASFEVKAGYEVLLSDIYIPRNIAPEERIRLFVAQSDNIASSTCIISPSQVNFLINGKGVERRTNVSVDNGPQFPTDITKMLKYGLNLFQAAGSFSGNYVVTICVMKAITSSEAPVLQDYVQPDAAAVISDTEIIEGPSRISLNCPISLKRIKTPVKGHLCKHHQCFDFSTYMEMNSKKPSWRCPHCNQSVNYIDIRIDQNMVKILAEAGEDVSVVIISADGTWKAAEEHQNNATQMHKRALTGQHENNTGSEPIGMVSDSISIMDLTAEEDCENDTVLNSRRLDSQIGYPIQGGSSPCEIIDRKPLWDYNLSGTAQAALQVSREIYSGISHSSLTSNLSPSICRTSGQMITAPVNTSMDAADRSSLFVTRVPETMVQNAPQLRQAANNLQLQQQQLGSIIRNEAQRLPIPRHITRTPIAVQALPAMQNQNLAKRPRISEISPVSLNVNASCVSPSRAVIHDGVSKSGAAGITSSAQHHSIMQPFSNQARQQIVGLPAQNQVSPRASSDSARAAGRSGPFLQPHMDIQNSRQQRMNVHAHQTLSQLANTIRPSLRFNSPKVQQASQHVTGVATGNLANQPSYLLAAKHASAPLMTRLHHPGMPPPQASMTTAPLTVTVNRFRPSVSEQMQNMGGGSQQAAMRTSNLPESPTDSNWRPTGRMRGSLTGGAYSAALSRYTAQTLQALASPSTPTAASGLSSQAPVYNSNSTAQTPTSQSPVDGDAG